jgi:hypothetical protein
MAINCSIDAIVTTGADGREIAVVWAELDKAWELRHLTKGSIRLIPNPLGCQGWTHSGRCDPLSGSSRGSIPRRLASLG